MNNNFKAISMRAKILFFSLCLIFLSTQVHSQCGLDIHIANDNSGSVDGFENRQARAFISYLGATFAPLGNANTESRINISTWADDNNFEQYTFPIASNNFTTNLSDVLSYAYSARTFTNNISGVQLTPTGTIRYISPNLGN